MAFTNPNIKAIDDAFSSLEPCLSEFAHSHGFVPMQSHEGSFNVPRRWLRREVAGIRQEIGLIVAVPMPQRLERGFYLDIPCTLYIAAFDREARKHYHVPMFEGLPFRSVKESLSIYISDALARLNDCTSEFVSKRGTLDHAVDPQN